MVDVVWAREPVELYEFDPGLVGVGFDLTDVSGFDIDIDSSGNA